MPPLITREEALELAALTAAQDVEALVERAWRVRVERFGDSTDLCAAGGCAGGCDALVAQARDAEAAGAHRLCISEGDLDSLLAGARAVAAHTNLKRCASAGATDRESARRLRRAGVQRVHLAGHRDEDVAALRRAGLETCLGAALGGSTLERIDVAFELAAIEPTSVVLTTGAGDPWETAKWVAIFRLVLPGTLLRAAGALHPLAVRAGLNGAMLGSGAANELAMFQTLGLNVARQPDNGARPRPDNRSGWLLGETPDIVGDYLATAAEPGTIKVRLWDPSPAPLEVSAARLEAA